MKHLFKALFLLLALLLPVTATAHDFEVDGIYYNINGDEVTVTYKGNSSYNANSYCSDVTIPATVTHNGTAYSVTSIGYDAFRGCSGLTSVTIPNSVTSIGSYAFSGCQSLTSIEIPNSITSISNSAFSGTAWYDNQPDGLVYAGLVAYKYKGTMPQGTSITIREGTVSIAFNAFSGCSGLANIDIPNSVISIDGNAFSGCNSLTSVTIPNSVTSICNYTFENCSSLTNVVIPNSVSSIGNGVFSGCLGLTNIEIPNSVISIGGYAFRGCNSLTSITIPNSVTSIGSNAFSGTAWYNNQPDGLVYAGLVAYKYKGTMPQGTSITIREGTVSVASYAFSGCSGLTSVTIPNSVTSICSDAFSACRDLTSVTVGNSVTSIGDWAFTGCSQLYSVNFPYSIASIGKYAFYGCSELISIEFPNSVTAIGYCAFDNTAWYNNQPDGVVYAGLFAYAFKGEMPNGSSIVLKEGTLGIADAAFGMHEEEKSGKIPTEVSRFNLSCLARIVIPNSVKYIGNCAFLCCSGLTSIYMGNSVETIGDRAFSGCSKLTDVCCYGATPPVCDDYPFSHYSATLHVPAASLAAYFTAPYWSNFENIVGDAVAPLGISISQDSVEIQLGEQLQLTATVSPANASYKEVMWISSNDAVATVDNGMVTTVGIGECDIIASCFGMQVVCHVSVFNRISMEQQEAMLLPNHMLTLTPTAPVMPNGFTVTSSDPTVAAARVMNGKVQIVGIKEGTTMIMVGSSDGTAIPATCLVTVYTERGDLNCDGFVNMDDLTSMINYLVTNDISSIKLDNADVNHSGSVNMDDLTSLINYLVRGEF